jgi:hypothetical protein
VNVLKPGDLVRRRIIGGALSGSRKDHKLGLIIGSHREDPADVCEVRQLKVQWLDSKETRWFYEHQLENASHKGLGEKNV